MKLKKVTHVNVWYEFTKAENRLSGNSYSIETSHIVDNQFSIQKILQDCLTNIQGVPEKPYQTFHSVVLGQIKLGQQEQIEDRPNESSIHHPKAPLPSGHPWWIKKGPHFERSDYHGWKGNGKLDIIKQ